MEALIEEKPVVEKGQELNKVQRVARPLRELLDNLNAGISNIEAENHVRITPFITKEGNLNFAVRL